MRKIIAFDIDDTLVASKSLLQDRTAELLGTLLEKYEVAIISGGLFDVIRENVLDRLQISGDLRAKIHILPTCGTRYTRYDTVKQEYHTFYRHSLTATQKRAIREAFESGAKAIGIWEDHPYGEIIEDRDSQLTYSALGQDIIKHLGEEGLKKKYSWDPDMKKRNKLRDLIAPKLDGLEVRVGGLTSIDVTLVGVDKAYGIGKLLEMTGYSKEDILFVGDMLQEGGNDFPVKEMGVDCIAVRGYEDTPYVIAGIIGAS